MTPSYFSSYENIAMERSESGILTVRFHTDGGPLVFTGRTHRDLPKALAEIGADRGNKVLILTGTGDVFMEEIDGESLGEIFKPGRVSAARPNRIPARTACLRSRSRTLYRTSQSSRG